MALTKLQAHLCRIIAERMKRSGESYLAGGVALNYLLEAPRISRDIDLFHDTLEAVEEAWQEDLTLFKHHGYDLQTIRDVPGFKEALVQRGKDIVLVQWSRDSAFRFFPLIEDKVLGMMLHPFDLATNKTLALVGRLEPRDWIDLIECDRKIQPLGFLAWAACGKDPGFSPGSILVEARRSGGYSQIELDELAFADHPPDAGILGQNWHAILREANAVIDVLPGHEAGTCVMDKTGTLCQLTSTNLPQALQENRIMFRSGSIRGVLPTIRSPRQHSSETG